jgi:MFS family permease
MEGVARQLPVRKLCTFVLAVLLLAQLAVSAYAWMLSEQQFLPALEHKAKVVGAAMNAKLARAMEYGIPFERIDGVQDVFDDVLEENRDIAYLALSGADGKDLRRSGKPAAQDYLDATLPVVHEGRQLGSVHVGVDKRYLARRVSELRYDIGIVLLTSLMIAFEVLWFVMAFNTSRAEAAAPAHAQKRVVLVRILTFLFMFAEMLSRPFLPLYAGTLPDHGIGLPDGLRASLPITAFLLGVALSMPFAGRWSDKVGRRSSYLAGAALVVASLATTGLVPDYLVLGAARAATGVGYALMFMSCQGFVLDSTDKRDSARGMAMFVSAIMVAEICAPAVGGILADRIGFQMVFVVGAVVAIVAAALAARVLDNSARRAPAAGAAAMPLTGLARNRRFVALSVLSGIPAKFLYSGFLIFLVPLLLAGMGNTKSEIGRYTMLYGLMAVALAPLFARLADRYKAYAAMVAAGGLLTGLGLVPIATGASSGLVLLGIGMLGLGQSMSITAQLVLVARVTREEARTAGSSSILGVFRLVERLGAAAGPVVTGAIVAVWGASQAMVTLGVFGLCTSILFGIVFLLPQAPAREGAGT